MPVVHDGVMSSVGRVGVAGFIACPEAMADPLAEGRDIVLRYVVWRYTAQPGSTE
jgi:hypothetical protein